MAHRKLRVNKVYLLKKKYICLTHLDILNKPRKYNIEVESKTHLMKK